MGRRITRKQLKKDDEFVSAAEMIFRWTADNWRALIAGFGAVTIVALLWWAATSWIGARADDASLLLSQAVATFEGEPDPVSLVPAGDVEAAEEQFRQVVQSYGRTDQADMARLYLARIALGRGKTDEARPMLVDLSSRHPDDVIGQLASYDLIKLRIASGEGAAVAAELETMVTAQSAGLPRDAALYQLGELLADEGRPDRARPYFELLIEEFPESPYLANARQWLAELV
jgi:predicted negative regulator of RcsB-dependent stress response